MVTKVQKMLNSVAMEIKKGGILIFFLFLSSNFMKHCRNIHRSVWKLLAS